MDNRCLRGVNLFNELKLSKSHIQSIYKDRTVFELPIDSISSFNLIGAELALQFAALAEGEGDQLAEIRFYQQPIDGKQSQLEKLEQGLRERVGEDTDGQICSLPDLPFSVPRGRYSAEIFPTYIKFHGSSYNFSTSYQNISKVFCLEMPDKANVCFVLGFEKPFRQGLTSYNYGVVQFRIDTHAHIEVKEGHGFPKKIEGPYFELFSKFLKSVGKLSIVVPSDFKSFKGDNAIRCQLGPKQGFLFVMNKSFLFLSKVVIHVRFDEMARVEMHRLTSNNKNFDMEIVMSNGNTHLFGGIEKSETDVLLELFRKQAVPIATIEDEENEGKERDQYEDSDESDDGFLIGGKKGEKENDDEDEDEEDYKPRTSNK